MQLGAVKVLRELLKNLPAGRRRARRRRRGSSVRTGSRPGCDWEAANQPKIDAVQQLCRSSS